MSINLFTWG